MKMPPQLAAQCRTCSTSEPFSLPSLPYRSPFSANAQLAAAASTAICSTLVRIACNQRPTSSRVRAEGPLRCRRVDVANLSSLSFAGLFCRQGLLLFQLQFAPRTAGCTSRTGVCCDREGEGSTQASILENTVRGKSAVQLHTQSIKMAKQVWKDMRHENDRPHRHDDEFSPGSIVWAMSDSIWCPARVIPTALHARFDLPLCANCVRACACSAGR